MSCEKDTNTSVNTKVPQVLFGVKWGMTREQVYNIMSKQGYRLYSRDEITQSYDSADAYCDVLFTKDTQSVYDILICYTKPSPKIDVMVGECMGAIGLTVDDITPNAMGRKWYYLNEKDGVEIYYPEDYWGNKIEGWYCKIHIYKPN